MTLTWALKEETDMQRSSIQERTARAKAVKGGKKIQKAATGRVKESGEDEQSKTWVRAHSKGENSAPEKGRKCSQRSCR